MSDFNQQIQDTSDHLYSYGFDFDVMHPLMFREFKPFFLSGKCLELGSHRGRFTRRLLEQFDFVTCIEGSSDAAREAERILSGKARIINATFEDTKLPEKFENIVFTHVLEHIEDPLMLLKKIHDDWLAPGGRLFLVCPNAEAASRQIAVSMGLISSCTSVTRAESLQGHKRTYTMSSLAEEVIAAGFHIEQLDGIFFKALANFQWDQLLRTEIISPEYIEGCYQLGKLYPNLCASICAICS
jgi:2-polyprenyl-3-methyl-5-hydroxy-6-metoxy-1,4-benzoquinol methylase